jgi:hypothetical protein
MKKTFALFLALTAFALISARAQEIDPVEPAQDTVAVAEPAPVVEEPLPLYTDAPKVDKQIFNHLSVGVELLGLEGAGVQVATTLTPHVQIRAGYSIFPYSHKQSVNLGQYKVTDERTIDLTNTPVKATLWDGGLGNLMFDIFPGKHLAFHFTVGMYIGTGKFLSGQVDAREPILRKDEYASLAISYGDAKISSDENGQIYADVGFGTPGQEGFNNIFPYAGIGFGHAVGVNKRVGVTFDMGVIYTGGIKAQAYNFHTLDPVTDQHVKKTCVVTSQTLTDDDGKQMDSGMIDKIGQIPVFPMMRLTLVVRIF